MNIRKILHYNKTFSYDRSQSLIGKDHIGYTIPHARGRNKTNKAKLVFNITNVHDAASYNRGGALTGYPYD